MAYFYAFVNLLDGQITSIPLKIRQSIPIMDDDEIRKAGV